jgi:hypothetical protein
MSAKNFNKSLYDKLGMKEVALTDKSLWIPVTIPQNLVDESIRLGNKQQDDSRAAGLNDNRFLNTDEESLNCTIESKGFEYAIQTWGGGTARVTQPNEFHMYPDVGQVNARHVNDPEDGLMIMKRDQGMVPIILGTGKMPNFLLMGWFIPNYAKQFIYRINLGRGEFGDGFLQEMQNHEACTFSKQWLFPMWSFNKELIK